jgi:hypothetical protein
MKRERETSEAAALKRQRAADEGETTVFWRPQQPSRPLNERYARRRTAAYAAGAAVALVGSLVGLIGWARAPSAATANEATAVRGQSTAPARAPIRLAALSLVASAPIVDGLEAVLEAVDVTTVRASEATAGAVRRVAPRGSPVSRGSPLVTLRRPDLEPPRRLAALDALLEEYDESAPAIERARAEYEAAVARSSDAAVVRAPAAGIVVGAPLRPGDVAAAGDELARIAAAVQLVLPAGDVEGDVGDCRVALLDRGRVVVDGKLVPAVADARSRTVTLARFPADVPLGAVGRVKAVCR